MSETERDSNVARLLKGWILYDGGCGFCFRWVHFWEKVVARRGFEPKDLQSAEEEGILQIPAENLLDDIRVGRATLKGEGANILFGWLFPCVYYTLGIGGPPYAPIAF